MNCCGFVVANCTIYSVQTKPNDVNQTELLQKALLEYLAHGSENDPSLIVSASNWLIVA